MKQTNNNPGTQGERAALMRQQEIVQIPFDIHWKEKLISTKSLLQSRDKEQCYFRTSDSAHQLPVSEVLWAGQCSEVLTVTTFVGHESLNVFSNFPRDSVKEATATEEREEKT